MRRVSDDVRAAQRWVKTHPMPGGEGGTGLESEFRTSNLEL